MPLQELAARTSVVAIKDLWSRTVGPAQVKLLEHPFCTALQQDSPTVFEAFMATTKPRQQKKPTGSWAGLGELVRSIKSDGFRIDQQPIVFKRAHSEAAWHCSHGRHRMCVAAFLYGGDCLVELLQDAAQPNVALVVSLVPPRG